MNIDKNIINHVNILNIKLYWTLLFNTGIRNQKVAEPQSTENGVSPSRGINVLGLFFWKVVTVSARGITVYSIYQT